MSWLLIRLLMWLRKRKVRGLNKYKAMMGIFGDARVGYCSYYF